MPELPEIETVKLQLQKYLIGQTIGCLDQLHKKSVIGDKKLVTGKKITGVRRLGKMLVLDLDKDLCIAIHFKMSGQLVLIKKSKIKNQNGNLKNRRVGGHPTKDWVGELPSSHTRAIFYFKNGTRMFFNDQRIFGWIEINSKINPSTSLRTKNQKSKMRKYIEHLGQEPWAISDRQFFVLIKRRNKVIKLVIMDQEVISGVGNIYANDALWEARIHPEKRAKTLRQEDCKTLRQAIIKVLKEGIKYGGATATDAKYVNLEGFGGRYQEHFRVYDREGKKCLRRDGGIIKKITLGGRGTYFCPECQKNR